MAEDILGISGQMDITDIQKSFDTLSNNLNQLGIKTDEVSAKMTKALNDIASSASSDASKTQQSIQTLKDGIAEINKSLADTPESIKRLAAEAQAAEATVEKLKARLSETAQGSNEWNALSSQLANQQQLVTRLNDEYNAMLGTFGSTQQHVGALNAAIDTLNAGRSVSTATTAASTVAHIGAASAVGSESLAHGKNASSIGEETQNMQENIAVVQQKAAATKQGVIIFNEEAAAIDAATDRLRANELTVEEYSRIIEGAKEKIAALTEESRNYSEKAFDAEKRAFTWDVAKDGTSKQTDPNAWDVSQGAKEKANELNAQISKIQSALDNLQAAYKEVENAAISEAQAGVDAESQKTDVLRQQTDELEKNKQAAQDKAEKAEIWWGDEKATIESVVQVLQEDEKELKQLKAEYATLKGAGEGTSEAAKQNLEDQKALNKHIAEGRDILKQLGTTYEDAKKGAKETAEETKKIGDSADKVAKKVDGIFAKLKGGFSKALSGDFSALFGMLGKVGAWGAGIAAVGKSIYELTVRAEEFRDALQPLSHYLDDSTLGAVRQNIIALSGNTTKSVSDMAAAATQFVKVWDGMKSSPEALTQMIKSANEFGALTGKTSEEGAKYLSNLASEYHMTAEETTEASAAIAMAAHNSTSTFGEMADAVSSAGSTASLYGVSFKEMTSLIGFSSGQFGGAQKAASKFSMLLMSMSKMQDDYNPSVVGMIKALQNLKDAYDRGEHVENNFMARNRKAAMYFIKNADSLAKYTQEIGGNAAKQELLNDVNAKASVNVAKLANSWNGFLTAINANLTPTLTKILNFFTRVIGGAQRTADELDYLKHYDEIHPNERNKSKNYTKSVTGGWTAGFKESHVANMGAVLQDNATKEDNLDKYRSQRNKLETRYKKQFEYYKTKHPTFSTNALLNATDNALLKHYNASSDTYTEYNKKTFWSFLKKQHRAIGTMQQKTINTSVDNGGDSYHDDSKAEEKAKKDRAYREQQAEQQAKQQAEAKKTEWELYVAEQEAGIAKEHDANEKELKQRKLDFEKKKRQIEDEAEQLRQKNIEEAKASYEKNPANEKKEGFYARGLDKSIGLTSEQQALIDAKTNKLNEEQAADEAKRLKEQKENERTSVQSYFKEYGNNEEKRSAIKDEAEDKKKKLDENKSITDTDRDYQKKSIDASLKKELQDLDFQDLKKSINWDFVFGDLEHVSATTLETVKQQLQDFINSAKDLKPDEIKTVVDAMTQIQDKIDLTNPIKSIKDARTEYKALSKEYAGYKKQYDDASASRDVEAQKSAAEKMIKTEQKMVKAQSKEKASYEEVMNVAQQYAQALNDLGDTIGGTTGECIKLAASAISAGLGMAEGIKKFGDAVSALEKSVAILAIIEAALKAIQVITQLFGDTADATLTDYVETLDIYINLLNDSISDLNDSMSDAQNSMKDTIAYYKDLVELEKDSATAIKSQSQTWLNSGASKGVFGIKSSSSEGVKIRKQIEKDLKSSNAEVRQFYTEGYNALNEYYKKVYGTYAKSASDFGRMDFLWKLSDEDLIALSEDTKAMSLLGDTLSSAITKYAEKLKSIQDDEDSLGESLLSVSFDDFYDDFTSLIKDMDNDSEDFANNFAEYMRNALVKNLVAEQYKGKLEALYQKAVDWGKQGVLEDHIDELKKEYEEYADAAKEDVETIDKITGYEDATSQSATTKAIEAITADQASSLIGIGYAMQVALEQGNETRALVSEDVSVLRGYSQLMHENITEMRDIQYEGLGQLQQIAKNTAPITLIREDISSMYKLMKERY